jgi:glycyl-tRNA synthetase
VEDYTPNVIEPSFGLGRILYALLEHSYWARESDIARGVLSLPALVAPIKVLIVPISSQEVFKPIIDEIGSFIISRRWTLINHYNSYETSKGWNILTSR